MIVFTKDFGKITKRMLKILRMTHVTTVVPKGTMPTSAPSQRSSEGAQAARLRPLPDLPLLGAPEARGAVPSPLPSMEAPMATVLDQWIRYATSTSHGARLSKEAPKHALLAKTADSSMLKTSSITRRSLHPQGLAKESPVDT